MKRHTKSLLKSLLTFLSLSVVLLFAESGTKSLVRAQEDVFTNIAYPIHLNAPEQEIKGGSIVSLKDSGYMLAGVENDEDMIGVISEEPGVFYQGDVVDQNAYLASGGTTYILVNTTNGSILKGDHITSSESAGVGVKAIRSGKVIGRALESYDGAGVGKISANIKPEMFESQSDRANKITTTPVLASPVSWNMLVIVIVIFSVVSGFILWRKTHKP